MHYLPFWRFAFLAASLLGGVVGHAVGQTRPGSPAALSGPADSTKVYNYVEQMPQLPGYGGSGAAIAAAIRDKLAGLAGGCGESRVFVAFIVDMNGAVTAPRIVKGAGNSCDETTLAAVRELPRFQPGRQNGRPVNVSYTVLISQRAPTKKSPK